MREELKRLRKECLGVAAVAFEVDVVTVMNRVAGQLEAILAKDAEKPSEGKETQKNGISGLVRDHKIRMAGFTEGYAQGLEAAANDAAVAEWEQINQEVYE